MKSFAVNFWTKTAAFVLFVLISAAALALAALVAFFAMDGYYDGDVLVPDRTADAAFFAGGDYDGAARSYTDSSLCHNAARKYCDLAAQKYLYEKQNPGEDAAALYKWLDPAATNFRYTIWDEAGNTLYENISGEDVVDINADSWTQYAATAERAYVTPTPTAMPMVGAVGDENAAGVEDGAPLPTATPVLGAVEDAAGAVDVTPTPTAMTMGGAYGDENAAGAEDGAPLPTATPMLDAYEDAYEGAYEPENYPSLDVHAYLLQPLLHDDVFLAQSRAFDLIYPLRYWAIALCVLLVLVSILLFVYLLRVSGHHADGVSPRCGSTERIPFDLYTAATALTLYIALSVTGDIGGEPVPALVLALLVIYVICCLTLLFFFMTFAVRVKTRTLIRNTVVWMVLSLAGRALRWVFRGLRGFWRNRALLTKAVLLFCGVCVAEAILVLAARHGGFAVLLFLLFNAALLVAVCGAVLQLNRLARAGETLAAGRLDERADTNKMYWDFKKHGENLNSISDGIGRAVDARLKSERMKTDLITNVSHDLKTPLTAIVSYVDLLKKEELGNDTAAGYVEVLDRQATRLKKLTEDLVEASKASSGTLAVALAPTGVSEVIGQSLGEYAGRLESADLTVVAGEPGEGARVRADGRLLWRVFDNIFSNVVKYSMPGTRVYVDVRRRDGKTEVRVKNISRDALNIPASELVERFVRGDASRSTDGSGLGLSIAKSLVELMGGEFDVEIDGDLFTAVVRLADA